MSYATERAKLMFGCYRRGDANDPDTYVAAVAMVLAKYPIEVIKSVTDPYSGLPGRKSEAGWSGMPDVADVREACDAEARRLDMIERYRKLPPPAPRLENGLRGRERANLFVPDTIPIYPELVRRHNETQDSPCTIEGAHVCKDGEQRAGIMVPMDWYDRPQIRRAPAPKVDQQGQPIPFDDEAAA